MKNTDIVIIGAGIAGISSAIYLNRMNANFILLEGEKFGGLLNDLQKVENFPALGLTDGNSIKNSLKFQIDSLGIKINYENAQTILKNNNGFEVVSDKYIYQAKAVIIATGNDKTIPSILNEDKYLGSGVSYCATCDGNFFKNLDVAVIGNGNTVIEESLYLSSLVKALYLISDSTLVGDSQLLNKVKERTNIKIIENCSVLEILGNDFSVTGIKTSQGEINVSGVFPYVGKKSSNQLLQNLSPFMNNNHVVVDETMKTNIEGLFAAGDIVDKKLRQLITASSDGASAAVSADNYIKRLSKE